MTHFADEATFLTSAVHVEPSGFKTVAVSFEHSPKLDAGAYANAIANVFQKYHPHLELTYLCSSTDEKTVFVQYQIGGVGYGKLESMITDTKDAISAAFTEMLAKSELTVLPTNTPGDDVLVINPPKDISAEEIGLIANVLLERNSFTVNATQYVN